ncbi:NaeI family type II restriction endonuclease [Streptomyces sp. PKU-EA00015]|uniref:NaeI family type II restriction endonuclease n=1 Tax=Streptomyces sp. PKU-EA00015 TaxID=2748326 RepID=UPI001C42EDDE|nr:NaeI family type II restriction endonuclease [Streptomyces sp. PKU-EA00015]
MLGTTPFARSPVEVSDLARSGPGRVWRDFPDEGITVLGHRRTDQRLAANVGVPVPRLGEWVSVRLPFRDIVPLDAVY